MILLDKVNREDGNIDLPVHDISFESSTPKIEDFTDNMATFIKGAYESVKDTSCNNNIIMEASLDANKFSTKFFTAVKSDYRENIANLRNKAARDLTEAAKKYQKIVTNQTIMNNLHDITLKGFKYTTTDSHFTTDGLSEIMYKAEQGVAAIESANADFSSIVNYYCGMIGTEEQYARLRGILVGRNFCPADRYGDELFKYFRNGESRPSEISFREKDIYDVKWALKDMRMGLDECEREYQKITAMIDNIITYVNTQPVVLADNLSILKAQDSGTPYVKYKVFHVDGEVWDRNQKYNALATIYSRTNAALRGCLSILNKFVIAKLNALSAAAKMYDQYFNKVLGAKSVSESTDVRTWYDYLDEHFEAFDERFENQILEAYITELHTLSNGLMKGKLLYEAGGVEVKATNVAANRTGSGGGVFGALGNFIQSILNFINEMLGKFVNNIKGLEGMSQDLANDAQYLKNIPEELLNDMTLTYPDPIDNDSFSRLASHDIPINNKNFDAIADQIANQNITKDQVYPTYFKELYAINNNDYKEAAYRYYHGHNEKITKKLMGKDHDGGNYMKVAKGKACLEEINRMFNYCMNLQPYAASCQATMNKLKQQISKHSKQLDQLKREAGNIEADKARAEHQQQAKTATISAPIQQTANAMGVKATTNSWTPSFSMLEDAPIEESTLRDYLVDQFDVPIVFEAPTAMGNTAIANSPGVSIGTSANPAPAVNAGAPAAAGSKVINPQGGKASTGQNVNQSVNQVQGKPGAQPQQKRNFDQELSTNKQAQEKARTIQMVYHIAVAVAAQKMSVTEKLFKDYYNILKGVVAKVKQYHGIKEDEANEADRRAKVEQNRQDQLDDLEHKRQVNKANRKAIDAGKQKTGGLIGLAKWIATGHR